MSIIEKVLSRGEFEDQPPVLIDIGASGKIHKSWEKIAKYSICIAFDADKRDFQEDTAEAKKFKKLYTFNCIVSDQETPESTFYLTKYPHCSSLLKPDSESLQEWSYASYFKIEKEVKIKTKTLPSILNELSLSSVDWFKSDSQGIDLRLFKSLGASVYSRTLMAEFEPGIISAYQGEDKMHHVLEFMDSTGNFWLSDLIIKGSQKISEKHVPEVFSGKSSQKLYSAVGRKSAGWGEMIYINKFKGNVSKRDLLLGWVFATIQNQNGFAYELAAKGKEKFGDRIFSELEKNSKGRLSGELITSKYFSLAYNKIMRGLGL